MSSKLASQWTPGVLSKSLILLPQVWDLELCSGAVAGTNNARIANMLRSLANYYAKEANHLFLVCQPDGCGRRPFWKFPLAAQASD